MTTTHKALYTGLSCLDSSYLKLEKLVHMTLLSNKWRNVMKLRSLPIILLSTVFSIKVAALDQNCIGIINALKNQVKVNKSDKVADILMRRACNSSDTSKGGEGSYGAYSGSYTESELKTHCESENREFFAEHSYREISSLIGLEETRAILAACKSKNQALQISASEVTEEKASILVSFAGIPSTPTAIIEDVYATRGKCYGKLVGEPLLSREFTCEFKPPKKSMIIHVNTTQGNIEKYISSKPKPKPKPVVHIGMFARSPGEGCVTAQEVPIQLGSLWNLALLRTAVVTTSSVIPIHTDRHKTVHVNDGWYSNCKSWIPANADKQYMQIDFGRTAKISKVSLGSDYTGQFGDRKIKNVRILIDNSVVKNVTGLDIHRTLDIDINPVKGSIIKVIIWGGDGGHPARVDELRVWGLPL